MLSNSIYLLDVMPTTILTALLILYASVAIVYQTTFHPLAKYPGPFLAKLSSLYLVYHAVRGTNHTLLYELHRKHGAFVRYGPNHISINSATALEKIYGQKANVKKSNWYGRFYSISIFNAVDKDVHARKKRVMSQAFSDAALRGMQPHILSAIRTWCAALGDNTDPSIAVKNGEWSSPKDMAHWGAYMIFDVLGEICFGRSFYTSIKNDNRYFLDLMVKNVRITNVMGQMPILHKLKFATIMRWGDKDQYAKQIAFSRKQLQNRLTVGPETSERRDIIHYLQKARDPETGEGYSEQELMSETTLLLGAGSDTANTALAASFYFLVHHPDVLARLTTIIRTSFPDLESIASGPTLNSMTYLRACIDECLRLCPPIPKALSREVLPGGLQVDGEFFPEGVIVGVPTYALHHSEKHFERPFVYDPSRWLVEGAEGVSNGEGRPAEDVTKMREAFIPFSLGPRQCIGKNVALLELYVGVARALWLYNVRILPGYEWMGVGREGEYKIKDNFIVGKEGPMLQFQRRI